MANEKRLRLLGLVGSTGQTIQLAQPLLAQRLGYVDTIILNTPYLEFGDGTILGGNPNTGGVATSGPGLRVPAGPGWRPGPVNLTPGSNPVPIASDQYLPVVIDPSTGYAEEVWITALQTATSTTSTWTCVRGVGSSTGAPAHAASAYVVNAPTPYDRLPTYDDPWGGNRGYDYEFQGDSTGQLPGYTYNGTTYNWTWLNQGTSTYSEAWGAGVMDIPGSASTNIRGVYLPVLPTPPFTVTAKIQGIAHSSNFSKYGLMLTNGTGVYACEAYGTTQETCVCVEYYSNLTTFSSAPFAAIAVLYPAAYFQFVYSSTAQVTSLVSTDGRNWASLVTGSMAFTPTGVGIMADSENSFLVNVSVQFFRVR